jgi:hypothetical protein
LVSPIASISVWKADREERPIGKRVKDVGKSECHPVMGWIRVQDLPGMKMSRLPTGVESREKAGMILIIRCGRW